MGVPTSAAVYTTRLLKVGANVDDMRRIMAAWDGRPGAAGRVVLANPTASPSRKRIQDLLASGFVPRFVKSAPPELWRAVAVLDSGGVAREVLTAVHYYAAAAAEPLIWDFVTEELAGWAAAGRKAVDSAAVMAFLRRAEDRRFSNGRWSEAAVQRVARSVLTTLRDFGVLRGAAKKRLATPILPVEAFAFLAMVRQLLARRGARAIHDPCWRLFFLGPTDAERLFVEAQQAGLLRYEAAGTVIRVTFPVPSLEEYAHVLAG